MRPSKSYGRILKYRISVQFCLWSEDEVVVISNCLFFEAELKRPTTNQMSRMEVETHTLLLIFLQTNKKYPDAGFEPGISCVQIHYTSTRPFIAYFYCCENFISMRSVIPLKKGEGIGHFSLGPCGHSRATTRTSHDKSHSRIIQLGSVTCAEEVMVHG